MTAFNPLWGGDEYIQDTPPYDGMSISFLPSIVNDSTAAQLQLDSQVSTQSFMESLFRISAKNMYDSGVVVSSIV